MVNTNDRCYEYLARFMCACSISIVYYILPCIKTANLYDVYNYNEQDLCRPLL